MTTDTASTLTRLAPTQVELEIPLSAEEIAAAQQRAFARLARNVRLPGFRKGKIPRRIFEQNYGTDAIESEALDDMAPAAFARAVREHDLDPVDRPTIELLPQEEGKPARLKATVEVRPEIELGEYKGIAVDVAPIAVSDDDVERSLQSIARERATLVPVERPARIGDVVTIDYVGRIDDEPFEGGSASGHETELVEERYIPGFAAGIAGMTPSESKRFDATFPQDYPKSEYAGKTATFDVTLHEVKEIEVPPIDDELAKAASECESLESLRAEIRKRLEAVATGRRRRAIGSAVMEKLLARLDVPVPSGLLDREVESMLVEAAENAARAGVGFEEYLKRIGQTEDQLRSRYREEAVSRVKGTFAIEAIARAEDVEATPEDVREEIEALARQYGQPPERIRKAIGPKLASLKEGIVRTKTLEFLIDHAAVKEP
jgi:trigger factor